MKKLLTPILVLFILFGFKASATRTVTGLVTAASDNSPLPGVSVKVLPSNKTIQTDINGKFKITVDDKDLYLEFAFVGFDTKTIKLNNNKDYKVVLTESAPALQEVLVSSPAAAHQQAQNMHQARMAQAYSLKAKTAGLSISSKPFKNKLEDYDSYKAIEENGFRKADKNPLSTFSIDVDAASYSNIRRFINNGSLPPKDAVRIEEMVNYFDYEYEQPKGKDPVNIVTEIAPAPWNAAHRLVHIGLQGKTIATDNLPASNLVFLIDVSGSMSDYNKLPLLVSSFKLLTDQLRDKDKVAIVVYAGSSGLVLPSTSGDNKTAIKDALEKLSAGGSTAGGQGIELAYQVATKNFIKGGNNRVILATDGDFNVGANSDAEMQRLIEDKRKSGVYLTVLGFGMGNYKDSKMETLANKGNGNYAYIDNISEAKKVLINEFGGTLFTIAKDVKLQLEFNPAKVQAYRLIGYENRLLNDEDFNDDKKDAGELGSGHTVTAIYEIIPVGVKSKFVKSVDDLKYQKVKPGLSNSGELLTIKLRYKEPDGNTSKLLQTAVLDNSSKSTSNNFNFSAAVAEFGMMLRDSEFKQNSSFDQLISLAENSIGKDKEGYRAEFLKLARATKLLAKDLTSFTDRASDK